ncbi:MAG: hypothetical protein AB7O52_03960 [Planctomycetota bacterium]
MTTAAQRSAFTCWFVLPCLALLGGCASAPSRAPGLGAQLADSVNRFVGDLEQQGVPAQSHFAVFIPDGSVEKRHLVRFRDALHAAVREATSKTSLHFEASAERVFLLSEVPVDGLDRGTVPGSTLANEFRRGTHEGWVAFNSYWSQFNRLAIGDRRWIDALPDSVRGDLSNPLRFVLRVEVSPEANPSVTEFVHRLGLQWVEVGTERVWLARSYSLTLTYSLP